MVTRDISRVLSRHVRKPEGPSGVLVRMQV